MLVPLDARIYSLRQCAMVVDGIKNLDDLSLSALACLFSTIIHAMQAPPHNTPNVSIHNDYNFWRIFSSSNLFI